LKKSFGDGSRANDPFTEDSDRASDMSASFFDPPLENQAI